MLAYEHARTCMYLLKILTHDRPFHVFSLRSGPAHLRGIALILGILNLSYTIEALDRRVQFLNCAKARSLDPRNYFTALEFKFDDAPS